MPDFRTVTKWGKFLRYLLYRYLLGCTTGGSGWTLRNSFSPRVWCSPGRGQQNAGDSLPLEVSKAQLHKAMAALLCCLQQFHFKEKAGLGTTRGFLYPFRWSCDSLFAVHRTDTGSTNFSQESYSNYRDRANTSDLASTSSASPPSWFNSKIWLRLTLQLNFFPWLQHSHISTNTAG